MSRSTKQLVDEVREQLDESNVEAVSDQRIVNAMNRGQRRFANIVARKYESMFWTSVDVATESNKRTYDIPADAFGRRIEKVEVAESGNVSLKWEIKRISTHSRTPYTSPTQVTRPYYYTLVKNALELYPNPAGGQTLTIHYSQTPELLVLPQGRIVDVLANGFRVDALGSAMGTTTDDLAAYINVIDYNTGAVKGTFQVAQLDTSSQKIIVKSTLSVTDRTTVIGKVIDTEIDAAITPDDYVCVIAGTCVPEVPEAYVDYLVQYAVVETRRSLGEDTTTEYAHLKDLEKELEKLWVGRESSNRVNKASPHWKFRYNLTTRRYIS